jgi:hypothetical protein
MRIMPQADNGKMLIVGAANGGGYLARAVFVRDGLHSYMKLLHLAPDRVRRQSSPDKTAACRAGRIGRRCSELEALAHAGDGGARLRIDFIAADDVQPLHSLSDLRHAGARVLTRKRMSLG